MKNILLKGENVTVTGNDQNIKNANLWSAAQKYKRMIPKGKMNSDKKTVGNAFSA